MCSSDASTTMEHYINMWGCALDSSLSKWVLKRDFVDTVMNYQFTESRGCPAHIVDRQLFKKSSVLLIYCH
jgi:hypothetical protein